MASGRAHLGDVFFALLGEVDRPSGPSVRLQHAQPEISAVQRGLDRASEHRVC